MKLLISQTLPSACFDSLLSVGFEPILLPPFPLLPRPVASHADMLLFDLGDSLLMHRQYYETNAALFEGIHLTLSEEMIGDVYPNDVLFNALKTHCFVYGLKSALSIHIQNRFEVKHVKQGYARCSVCQLNESACITADPSLADALAKDGKSVLKIQNGHISLPGYDYGFIGGASFVFNHTLYTFGSLDCHPDGKSIAEFAEKNGVSVFPLSDEPLFDAGGAFVLRNSLQTERSSLCEKI